MISVDLSRIPPRTRLGRLLRAPLGWIPPTAVLRVLQGPLRGRRWIVGSATHGSWLGTYEREKQRRFARAISAGGVVFDLGANVGLYTMIAAIGAGETGRVFAFEPLPRNVAFLRMHLRLNGIGNVEVVEAAVSDVAGTIAFDERGGPALGGISPGGTLRVATVTLDDLVATAAVPPPDVLKIDIEGGELHALRGAHKVLEEARPVVFLATHGSRLHVECHAFLESRGYVVETLAPMDSVQGGELLARPGPAR